jgi:glycosyltransferase EpsD
MEAMASGLPVVCSDIRGNRDLIDTNGGMRCAPYDADAFAKAIALHMQNPARAQKEGEYNRQKALNYEKDGIIRSVLEIYRSMEVSA